MDKQQIPHKQQHWGTQLGAVLAVSGSAVGLGNFLRFPGQVVNNGGGAFLIPYLISLLIVAIPLASSEWALGRYAGRMGKHSPLGIFYTVGNKKLGWGLCGGFVSLVAFIIDMYYIFVAAWCLLYALQYLGGMAASLGVGFSVFPGIDPGLNFASIEQYKVFFEKITGQYRDGVLLSGLNPTIAATAFCGALTFYLIYRGISSGIERFCKIVAPLILLCSFAIIIRVATLGNPTGQEGQSFIDGLGFMWNPKNVVETLVNPEVWLNASAQIFFTISLCIGAICTYASFVRPKQDIALSSVTATATNEFCEVCLGGLIAIPPAIMFLGVNAAQHFDASYSLGFIVLPNVFGVMGGGNLFGFLFFMLLFFAAITTSVSFAQPTVSLFQEAFPKASYLKNTLLAAGLYVVGGGVVCWFTKKLVALNSFDFWIASFGPFVCAIAQTALIAFVWKTSNMLKELDQGAQMQTPRFLGPVVKWVSLPYLSVIFVFWCVVNLKDRLKQLVNSPAEAISFGFMFLLILGVLVLSYATIKRWRREEEKEESSESNANHESV